MCVKSSTQMMQLVGVSVEIIGVELEELDASKTGGSAGSSCGWGVAFVALEDSALVESWLSGR